MAVIYSATFEADTDGWVINTGSGSLSSSTEQGYNGTAKSLKSTITAEGNFGLLSPLIPVTAGEAYDITIAFMPGATVRPTYMQVDYYDDAFTYIGGGAEQYVDGNSRTSGLWSLDQLPQTIAPTNATQMRLIVQQRENLASGDYFYIDEINVQSSVSSAAAPTVAVSSPANTVWQDTITATATATDTESYSWSITSAPTDSTATLNGVSASSVTLIPDKVGSYTIAVTVTGPGGSATASAITTVGAMMWRKTSTGKVPVQIKRNQ